MTGFFHRMDEDATGLPDRDIGKDGRTADGMTGSLCDKNKTPPKIGGVWGTLPAVGTTVSDRVNLPERGSLSGPGWYGQSRCRPPGVPT